MSKHAIACVMQICCLYTLWLEVCQPVSKVFELLVWGIWYSPYQKLLSYQDWACSPRAGRRPGRALLVLCAWMPFSFSTGVVLFCFVLAIGRYGFISEGTVWPQLFPFLLLLTSPSERGSPGSALGGKPVYFTPAPAPGVFIPPRARCNGEEAEAGAGKTSDTIPVNTLQTVSGGLQGFCKHGFTLCWLFLNYDNRKHVFKSLTCIMYYIFTCRRSPVYSSSICLIEENPEIIGQAVLKKKNTSTYSSSVSAICYIKKVFSALSNESKREKRYFEADVSCKLLSLTPEVRLCWSENHIVLIGWLYTKDILLVWKVKMYNNKMQLSNKRLHSLKTYHPFTEHIR